MKTTVHAVVLEGIEQPLVWRRVDRPVLAEGEALVKVEAAAFNRRDFWIQKGQYAGLAFPAILGSDGAGIVEEVYSEKDRIWLEKEVIINPSLNWGESQRVQSRSFSILGLPASGTFAEYVKIPVAQLHLKPSHLSFTQAAALPLAGLTAYRALFSRAGLKKNEKLLVVGAGGGVSSFAILFGAAIGARVFATSGSKSKIEQATSLGAQKVSNYKSAHWDKELLEEVDGFDVIIDSALGEEFSRHLDLCLPGGRIVLYGGTAGNLPALNARKIFWKQLSIMGSTMGSGEDFRQMLELVERHRIVPVIDSVFPFSQAEQAIRLMDESNQFGKIILSEA